jgi:hypothetical protein
MKERINAPMQTLFLFGLLLLMVQACAIPSLLIKINTSHDHQARFEEYRTYNWYVPAAASPSQTESMGHSNLETRVKKAIEQEIEKKGLQKAAENPQVFLAFDVSLPTSDSPPTQPYAPGFGYGLAGQMGHRYDYGHANIAGYQPVNAYPPGTLLIDVIDARTRELVWRGLAEAVIEDLNADTKTVTNYVDDIIDKYPPAK